MKPDFFPAVHHALASGQRVFVSLVVEHTAHSPGSTGARLAVFEDGSTAGTIGGGVMEGTMLEYARRALKVASPPSPSLRALRHRKGPDASGLMCAGEQTNLNLVLLPDEHLPTVRALAEATSGYLSISETDVRVEPGLGGPQYELRPGPPWCYREQLFNLRRVLILGGGHCGAALSRLLVAVGFHVDVIDERIGIDPLVTNVLQHQSKVHRPEALPDAIAHPEWTDAIVMGQDIQHDLRSLHAVLAGPYPFIGLMGSPAKIAAIRRALREEGFQPQDVERIQAPVGVPIGSRTPEEIAVSVAAQLISRHRTRSGDHRS